MTPIYTPSIPFVSGAYPNQIIPYTDINKLIDNANFTFKAQLDTGYKGAGNSISQATSGTWTVTNAGVGDFNYPSVTSRNTDWPYPNIPLVIQATFNISASVAVANKALFAWFDNGVQVGGIASKFSAGDAGTRQVTIMKYLIPGSKAIDLRWQVESAAPNVTFTVPDGIRIVAWQV